MYKLSEILHTCNIPESVGYYQKISERIPFLKITDHSITESLFRFYRETSTGFNFSIETFSYHLSLFELQSFS